MEVWFGLFVSVLILFVGFVIPKFYFVFHRNQKLSQLPVVGSVPWIVGGRAYYVISKLLQGQEGLIAIHTEGVAHSRTVGNIFVSFVGWVPFVHISGGKDIRKVCSSTDGIVYKKNFGYELSRPLLGNSLLISSGSFWKHNRKIMEAGFTLKSLQKASKIVVELMDERLMEWKDRLASSHEDTIRLTSLDEMVSLTADTIGLYAFSEPFHGSLSCSFAIILSMLGWKIWQDSLLPFVQYLPTPSNITYWYHLWSLKKKIYNIIKERVNMKASEREKYHDILSLMIFDHDDGDVSLKMDLVQLRDECIGLVFAGHDTTASTLSWILYVLASYPMVQDAARKECLEQLEGISYPTIAELEKLKYIGALIKEVLRLYPPAVIGRTSLQKTTIGEYSIPKGSELFISIYGMHHNPLVWGQDVEQCKPERFLRKLTEEESLNYLPFGGTPRSCVGMRLAIIEMKIILWKILGSVTLLPIMNAKSAVLLPSLTLKPLHVDVQLQYTHQ